MEKAQIQVNGQCKYRYRAADRGGKAVDFLLTVRREIKATMRTNDVAHKVPKDQSGAHKAAIDQIIENKAIAIRVHQVAHHNNIAQQDHRAIKKVTQAMLGFNSFQAPAKVLAGIELLHMIGKGQRHFLGSDTRSFTDKFYAWAGQISPA